jgi:hypothetical protein
MNSDNFGDVLEEQFERTRKVLGGKAAEYATDDDRLHNFKVAAALRGCTLREAVTGMMVKHTVSVYDMAELDMEFPMEMWDEKITERQAPVGFGCSRAGLLGAVTADAASGVTALLGGCFVR